MAKASIDEQETAPEKHIPEKPAKLGKMKLPVIIGIIVLIIALPVIIIFILFKTMIAPSLNTAQQQPVPQQVVVDSIKKSNEENPNNQANPPLSEEDKKNLQYVETGRIMTNPRSSTNIIILNLAFEFLPSQQDDISEISKEGANSMIMKRILSRVQENVHSTLGNMSVDEVENIKKDTLPVMFKTTLRPIFHEYEMLLRTVIVKEYLVQ